MTEFEQRTSIAIDELYGGRLIVGFSLRQSPLSFDRSLPSERSPLLDGPELIFHQPISLGFDFWDIVEEEEFAAERNGMNLLPLPDTYGLDSATPESSCLLAIEMRALEALSIEQRFGLCLLPIGLVALSNNWRFLGYDVVAPGGLTSGLHQYNWGEMSEADRQRMPRGAGNSFGLVENEEHAQAFAEFFNREKLHHAPYYSMGLWVKAQTYRNGLFPLS